MKNKGNSHVAALTKSMVMLICGCLDAVNSRKRFRFDLIVLQETFLSYPEIGDSGFRCALWNFKQQLTLKVRARCGISIVHPWTSLYCGFRERLLCSNSENQKSEITELEFSFTEWDFLWALWDGRII